MTPERAALVLRSIGGGRLSAEQESAIGRARAKFREQLYPSIDVEAVLAAGETLAAARTAYSDAVSAAFALYALDDPEAEENTELDDALEALEALDAAVTVAVDTLLALGAACVPTPAGE